MEDSPIHMKKDFEPTNPLSMPFECFDYDSRRDTFPVRSHWHYFAEMILVREGTLLVGRESENYTVRPGELIVIGPQIRHALSAREEDFVAYDVIKLDLDQLDETPAYAPNIKSIFMEAEQTHQEMCVSAAGVEEMNLSVMIRDCIRETRSKAYAYDVTIKSKMYLICVELVRFWMKKGFNVPCHVHQSDPVFSITGYINRHIRDSLKVEDLAKLCGLSYPWFAKKFREIYGISCKEYIEHVRIAKVEQYLLFTDSDLTYISQETGYADCSHMIKDFKRLKNTTPGQYRLQNKNLPG